MLSCALRYLHTLIADIDPRIIHHREHGHQSPVLCADELAHAFTIVAIGHDTSGRCVDAQLVFKTDTAKIILRSQRSVCVHVIFRDNEKRDAARAFWSIGQPGEHQMHYILGQFMLTPSDVDFLTLDQIFAYMLAIFDGGGCCTQSAHIAAGLRLGQVHSARPFSAYEVRQIQRLLRV